ncbi:MAG: DUF1810 domain-containing protein [Litoreibacter sp.]
MEDFDDNFDDDDDELDMFVDAQDTVWSAVVSELTSGRKQTHWMWFVFPQLAELGSSDMAKLYGMHDLAEATEYLKHPVLGSRLIEVCKLVLSHTDQSAEDIFGSLDAQKLQSSMTLFAAATGADDVFAEILAIFFNSSGCAKTQDAIG